MIISRANLDRVTLGRVSPASESARLGETNVALTKSLDTLQSLAEVKGRGTEIDGKGDPRIPQRRGAVGNLMAARDEGLFEPERFTSTEALQKNTPADLAWLQRAERTDYVPAGNSEQFEWAANYVSGGRVTSTDIQSAYDSYLSDGLIAAEALRQGAPFFNVSDGNLAALLALRDAPLRSRCMADALLQIRARTDSEGLSRFIKWSSSILSRMDVVGPAQTAVERQLLAQLDLQTADVVGVCEYALMRELIAASSGKNGNNIFRARNAVGALFSRSGDWVKNEVPPGAVDSPYESIHHNFSRASPHDIAAFVNEWMFPLGAKETRGRNFLECVDALDQAQRGDSSGARTALAGLEARSNGDPALELGLAPLFKSLRAAPDSEVGSRLESFLNGLAAKPLGADPAKALGLAAEVYRTVCQDRPSVEALQRNLFHAGPAYLEVAGVLARLRSGEALGTLLEVGDARLALRDAILHGAHGYQKQERMLLDADLNRLMCEELGAAVSAVGNVETDGARTHSLVAVEAALKGIEASGLHGLRDPNDAAAGAGDRLPELRQKVEAMLAGGKTTQGEYRKLMGELHRFSVGTAQDIRSFFDGSAARVATADIELDPFFLDQFLKQSPLHYLTALSEQGRRSGLREEISPRRIANVEGMRVLNGIGPTVYTHATIAEDGAQLARLAPDRNTLAIIHNMNEKKLVMAGGLLVDTKDAPGGNSHLNVYGMNNGIPVVALPELSRAYGEFFENAAREGGIYLDDTDGFQMMTLARAKEEGLVTDENQNDLRPGVNRIIRYLGPAGRDGSVRQLAEHTVFISPSRPTREVELYIPAEQVRGRGRQSMSFDELGRLGVIGRHLAGEKGLVLAMMHSDPGLHDFVPDGSVVTTGRVKQILRDAGLEEVWNRPFDHDPRVGRINDKNFTRSAFYTDAAYRARTRASIRSQTTDALTRLLLQDTVQGPGLTPTGDRLYAELSANPALANSQRWIARSSYTGEDRPGKSGAGQYESYPNLETPAERVKGIIGVLESAWDTEPVENNVNEEINLRHIMPSVVVQDCLDPDVSGVAVSKDRETQARGRVSYQLVRGFGGGVEGGAAEEGVIGRAGHQVNVTLDGAEAGLVSTEDLQSLRALVLKIERFFDEKIEPGKGHTVDVELARQGGQWKVVQARVLLAGA